MNDSGILAIGALVVVGLVVAGSSSSSKGPSSSGKGRSESAGNKATDLIQPIGEAVVNYYAPGQGKNFAGTARRTTAPIVDEPVGAYTATAKETGRALSNVSRIASSLGGLF